MCVLFPPGKKISTCIHLGGEEKYDLFHLNTSIPVMFDSVGFFFYFFCSLITWCYAHILPATTVDFKLWMINAMVRVFQTKPFLSRAATLHQCRTIARRNPSLETAERETQFFFTSKVASIDQIALQPQRLDVFWLKWGVLLRSQSRLSVHARALVVVQKAFWDIWDRFGSGCTKIAEMIRLQFKMRGKKYI